MVINVQQSLGLKRFPQKRPKGFVKLNRFIVPSNHLKRTHLPLNTRLSMQLMTCSFIIYYHCRNLIGCQAERFQNRLAVTLSNLQLMI